MPNPQPDSAGPKVSVTLALAGWLQPLLAADHPLRAVVCQAAAGGLTRLMAELGIPGQANVTLDAYPARTALDSASSPPTPGVPEGAWGAIMILQGQPCPADDGPAGRAALRAGHPGLREAAQLRAWLEPELAQSPEMAHTLVDFLTDACLETVKDHPEGLMGPAQARWIAQQLPRPPRHKGITPPPWPPDPDWLLPGLRTALGLGISLAQRDVISQTAATMLLAESSSEELNQRLAGSLAPREIAILLPALRFQELTLAWQAEGPAAFSDLRHRLARALGLNLPPFHLEPAADLGADEFALRVNALRTLPVAGLELANLLAALESELRRQFPRLVLLPRVEAQLGLLDEELREMAVDRLELARLTRLLRALAGQAGSLRRLPLLVEHLLDYPFYQGGASGSLALAQLLPPPAPLASDEFAARLAFLESLID